jgi:hypothetical protein
MLPTVGSYVNGLEHPHWRMWFGHTWTDFLGRDVLARAPALVTRALDEGGWFVQLHERPEEWNTPAGLAAAERFAAALGKPVFYDPAQPHRKLAAPDFRLTMRDAERRHPGWKEPDHLPGALA